MNNEADCVKATHSQINCHRTHLECPKTGLTEAICYLPRRSKAATSLRKHSVERSEDDRRVNRQVRLGQARRARSWRWTTVMIQSSNSIDGMQLEFEDPDEYISNRMTLSLAQGFLGLFCFFTLLYFWVVALSNGLYYLLSVFLLLFKGKHCLFSVCLERGNNPPLWTGENGMGRTFIVLYHCRNDTRAAR